MPSDHDFNYDFSTPRDLSRALDRAASQRDAPLAPTINTANLTHRKRPDGQIRSPEERRSPTPVLLAPRWDAMGPDSQLDRRRVAARATRPKSAAALTGLRNWRLAFGWSQTELARKANVGQDTISRLETGKNSRPYQPTAVKLATVFGVPVTQLFPHDEA